MQGKEPRELWTWAVIAILLASLGCNFSTPRGPAETTPEVVTLVVTASTHSPCRITRPVWRGRYSYL